MSMDRLIKAIVEKQNPTVAGLDPKLSYIPEYIRQEAFAKYGKNLDGAAAAILTYNKGLIDALCDMTKIVNPPAVEELAEESTTDAETEGGAGHDGDRAAE